jgi:hypothetical protein
VPWAAARSFIEWYKTVRPTTIDFGLSKRASSASRHCIQGATFAATGAALITLIDAAEEHAELKQWPGNSLQNELSADITTNLLRGFAEGVLIGAVLTCSSSILLYASDGSKQHFAHVYSALEE